MIATELRSQRLRLRPWCEADFEAFAAQYADPEASGFIGGPLDRGLAWRKLAAMVGHWQLRGFGPYALESVDGGELLGSCGLWKPEGWPETEIGYWLRPAHQGRGLATEAVLAVRAQAQQALPGTPLVSYVVDENRPSQAVCERSGCRLDGHVEILGKRARVYRHPVG